MLDLVDVLLRRPSLLVTPAPRDDDVFREEVLPPDKELLLLLRPLLALENELAMLRSAVTIGPSSPCAPHTIECAGQPLNWQAFRVVREMEALRVKITIAIKCMDRMVRKEDGYGTGYRRHPAQPYERSGSGGGGRRKDWRERKAVSTLCTNFCNILTLPQ